MKIEKVNVLGKEMKKGEKYEIWWIDTFNRSGWFSEEEIIKEAKAASVLNKTVGYFITKECGYHIIAMSECLVEGFDSWGLPKFIPSGTIKKVKKLK